MTQRVQKSVVLGTLRDIPTRKLALRALEKALAGINSVEYRPKAILSYGDFAQKWMDTVLVQHKPSSQNSEKVHMNRYIVPFFQNWQIADITPALVQQFVASLRVAPKTVRNIYSTFRSSWKTARMWGFTDRNVCEGIVMPRLNPVERRAFTVDEMKRIIEAAEEPFKTFFWLAAETGMRIGELCGIRNADINLARGTVQVRQAVWNGKIGSPKTGNAQRSFAISASLREHLGKFLSGGAGLEEGSDSLRLVFRTSTDKPWDSRFIIRCHLHPLLDKLGIASGGMHGFRHGNATALISGGADIKTVAARLGHSDPSITLKVYTHVLKSRDREVAEELGQLLCQSKSSAFGQKSESNQTVAGNGQDQKTKTGMDNAGSINDSNVPIAFPGNLPMAPLQAVSMSYTTATTPAV